VRVTYADQGMVPQTRMEARKKANGTGGAHSGAVVTTRAVQSWYVPVASLTSSGGRYYYDAPHGLGTLAYIVNIYDTNGVDLFPSEQNRGLLVHRVWLDYNTSAFTIVIY